MNKKMSYMELCLNFDEKEPVYLRVPTLWDDVKEQWIGFVKTPITNKLIHASGKTSFDLQNDFNRKLSEIFERGDEFTKEVYEMFMPAFYWEE